MTARKQGSTTLATTVAMPVDRQKMSVGEDGLPPLTIGMLLPLLLNGLTTRCGERP